MSIRFLFGICVFYLFFLNESVHAWWGSGHALLSRAAVQVLPKDIPEFFRLSASSIAAASIDADLHKNWDQPVLKSVEYSEHFIDMELLNGASLPELRYDFIALCYEIGVMPEVVGFAPYAAIEWAERLTIAFAEHRKWPSNKAIQEKCIIYAGFVAHYSQDLSQPLHTTIHYNGIKNDDGTTQYKGIHQQVDSVLERLNFTPESIVLDVVPVSYDSFRTIVMEALQKSHDLVDDVYDIGSDWERVDDSTVRDFSFDRARSSVRLTSSIFITAWKKSSQIKLPDWLER